MKKYFLILMTLLFVSGCYATVGQVSQKHDVTFSKDTNMTLYDGEEKNLNIILDRVIKKLNQEFTRSKQLASPESKTNVEVKIEVNSYAVKLMGIPPTRHWVLYTVKIIDTRNQQLLASKDFTDGQPDLPSIIDEMAGHISALVLKTL